MAIYKIRPIFKQMLWGGTRLRDAFHFDIPSETTGEAWVVSAHPDGDCVFAEGEFKDQTLSSVYRQHRELFGPGENTRFPLMVKIIDAQQDLSVQVHPDDEYAMKYENSYGKTEAWYVLDCLEGTRMIVGHDVNDKQVLQRAIESGNLEKHLINFEIRPGQFVYIPAKTIHAICAGSLIYEVQQNSNVTYRVYDFNRKDASGKLRELHIQKALDVTAIPHTSPFVRPLTVDSEGISSTIFLDEDYFSLVKLTVDGTGTYTINGAFAMIGVLEGTMYINGIEFALGQHAITTHDTKTLTLRGKGMLMISIPRESLL